MPTTVVDPIPRLEGHLKVTLEIDNPTNGHVTNAWLTGNLYRGFENFILEQNPLDAPLITQRVCGVCPTSHAVAAVNAIDDAANVQPTHKGRIMRNIINGAEFIHSNVLHTYHLALQDYIDMPSALGGTLLNQGPWAPLYGGDRRPTGADLDRFANSYITALAIRRKAHSVGAKLAGKQPHAASIIGGGCSATPSVADINEMRALVNEIKDFCDNTYLPDLLLLFNTYYPDYYSLGVGSGRLLTYGAFRQGTGSTNNMLMKRGIYDGSSVIHIMDHNKIVEDVSKGWYIGPDNLHPFDGQTNPDPTKAGGYSWLKSPRYKTDGINKDVYEVGPLARMVISGYYPVSISAADREIARAVESQIVANSLLNWLTELENNLSGPSFILYEIPANSRGVGLTEAIRGALGHWVDYDANVRISHYQIITPTCWNASPRDGDGVSGTIEQALIGTPVQDASQPVEALRIIHSYDPCLACSVHVIRDDGKTIGKFIV